MPSVTVRNVPEEVHRAIRVRAAQHGRSIEAEMRDILESAVRPSGRIKLGSLLAEIGREVTLSDEETAIFEGVRDKTQARAASFE
ncbi:Plasmid stability protein StbC [Pseudomonas reidholzensis]|uniref:Plasmid stability protein StbC n=1 Tax=Pseudomonas reidholzensis TaxID=1785162 RepID=A0A383RZV7_9PSED|nr:Arc family DNA-binding protein [Pseudomonas reidholzensis]SYX92283.1 Plasmid stability protein StbC [Pseudomonas reidholzensis]